MQFRFDKDIVLENEVALLRPVVEDDIKNLQHIALHEKDLLQYSPKPIHTLEYLTDYVQSAMNNRILGNRYSFCVYDKIKQGYAGSTSFLNISNQDDRLEI